MSLTDDAHAACTSLLHITCRHLRRACRAAADPLPLARAEHIIYAAAFFNKEADASRIYAEIVRDYNALTRPARANAPVVLWACAPPPA